MYPLNVVLVGFVETDALFDLRRELHNASVAVETEYPDVPAALAALPLLPNAKRLFTLFIKAEPDLKELEKLNEVFPGQPIMALLDPVCDAGMVLKAMRAGAAQVVVLPFAADDFQAAMKRLALQFGQVQTDATVIAVSGVSEGCGATTLSVNLAREIAHVHRTPCILAELSFQMGRLACYLNVEPHFTTADLLGDIDRIDLEAIRRALTEVAPNFSILAGPYQGIVPVEAPVSSVVRLLNYLRQLARVVIVDMPARFDATYFDTLAVASRVMLVAEQKVPSLHALRLVLDSLEQREVVAAKHVVINRYDPTNEAFSLKRLEELLKPERLLTVANDYPHLAAAVNAGRALRDTAPHCRALHDIDHLAAIVLGAEKPPTQHESFLSKLMHTFRG
ncbi:MAG: hypothetical protein JNM56_20435 [Planctomycetia bacterium]|nr:hypothetical protein [Planctomycetia bacterium]